MALARTTGICSNRRAHLPKHRGRYTRTPSSCLKLVSVRFKSTTIRPHIGIGQEQRPRARAHHHLRGTIGEWRAMPACVRWILSEECHSTGAGTEAGRPRAGKGKFSVSAISGSRHQHLTAHPDRPRRRVRNRPRSCPNPVTPRRAGEGGKAAGLHRLRQPRRNLGLNGGKVRRGRWSGSAGRRIRGGRYSPSPARSNRCPPMPRKHAFGHAPPAPPNSRIVPCSPASLSKAVLRCAVIRPLPCAPVSRYSVIVAGPPSAPATGERHPRHAGEGCAVIIRRPFDQAAQGGGQGRDGQHFGNRPQSFKRDFIARQAAFVPHDTGHLARAQGRDHHAAPQARRCHRAAGNRAGRARR